MTLPSGPEAEAEANELALVAALRAGDEAAFAALVDRYHGALVRLAQLYVGSVEVAEEVAQETWIGVLRGIDGFAGRASLKTWIFTILTNRAKTRGAREGRTLPFSALGGGDAEQEGPSVDPARFRPAGDHWAGGWLRPPLSWDGAPEQRLLSDEIGRFVRGAVAELPAAQRQVIALRDIEGWEAAEVCQMLAISEGNQRVLLHRARSKVRRALASYFGDD
jgi:RNA polymerase sigma-70 factor (ECF subfamily)